MLSYAVKKNILKRDLHAALTDLEGVSIVCRQRSTDVVMDAMSEVFNREYRRIRSGQRTSTTTTPRSNRRWKRYGDRLVIQCVTSGLRSVR